jgi:hypothetical protein
MRSVMDDLVGFLDFSTTSPNFRAQGLSPEAVGSSAMVTGDEEIFAFARACSRLVQMGSKEWAETAVQ